MEHPAYMLGQLETKWDYLREGNMFTCKSLEPLGEAEPLWEKVKQTLGQNGVDRLVTIITAFTRFDELGMQCR